MRFEIHLGRNVGKVVYSGGQFAGMPPGSGAVRLTEEESVNRKPVAWYDIWFTVLV
jgi:hypothetical protein